MQVLVLDFMNGFRIVDEKRPPAYQRPSFIDCMSKVAWLLPKLLLAAGFCCALTPADETEGKDAEEQGVGGRFGNCLTDSL